MLTDNPVEIMRQSSKPPVGIAHNHLRCLKYLPRCETETEGFRMDSHKYTALPHLIHFSACDEVAAVYKGHSITITRIFRCLRSAQNQGRVVMMAGGSSLASD